jgi:hypothetical protein
MTDELDATQFQRAISDAIKGVLAVYREADALLRELQGVLRSGSPGFVTLADRVAPGARRGEPGTRYLRSFVASVLAPADAAEVEDELEDDVEDEEDEDEDNDAPAAKKTLTLRVGTGLLIPRVEIFGSGAKDFVPSLVITSLIRSRVLPELPVDTPLKVSRSRFRKIVRLIDKSDGKTIEPRVSVHVLNKPKEKHKLGFTMASPLCYPLFDVTPDKLEAIADQTRKVWSS